MDEFIPSDERVALSLAEDIGHAPPFAQAELGRLERLVVSNARQLEWVTLCQATRSLVLMGCEVDDLLDATSATGLFPKLLRLELAFSSASGVRSFFAHPGLQDVSLMDSLVADASPLLTLPRRRHINLIGCPLSEESYSDIVPRLLREPAEGTGKPPKKVKVSPEPDWRVTLLIQSRGIRAVYSQGKALAPGLAYSDIPDLHSYAVSHDEVKRVLDQVEDGDLKGFMDRCKQIAFSK